MQRAGKAAAQAQAVREAEITAQESLELTKALLRVAVHHVSYLRGIFPEDNYRKVDMKNLDNMEVYMLDPRCAEAKRLHDWVQGGVGDALERRYLRKVFFGFSRDREGKDLLEEYIFTFSYDDNGEVHMAAGGRSSRGKRFSTKEAAAAAAARAKGPTLSQVKYQVCRLMRMLVEVTNTLEQVPEERYLFMKLTYTDDTPEEYEPPMFGPAPDGGVACFSRMPFVMEVGKVEGLNIKCGLAVKSLLDTVDGWGEDNDLPVADDNSLFFQDTTARPSHTIRSGQDSGTRDASMGGGFSCAGASKWTPTKGRSETAVGQQTKARVPGKAAEPEPAAAPASTTSSEPHRQQVGEVLGWVLGRPMEEVHVLDALARFSHIPSSDIDACFAILQRRGVLVPAGEADSYRVVKPAAAAAGSGPTAQPVTAAAALQPTEPAAAAAMMEAAEAMGRLHVGMDSQQGGMFEAPGTQATVSVVGKRCRMEAEEEQGRGEAPQQLLFPDTQEQSQNGVKRPKKASMVDDPIQQGRPKRVRAAAAAVPGQASAAPVRRSTRHMH